VNQVVDHPDPERDINARESLGHGAVTLVDIRELVMLSMLDLGRFVRVSAHSTLPTLTLALTCLVMCLVQFSSDTED
jgi:hypothetical protein